MYLQDIYTLALNLAGLPGMSIPAGFSQGLPVGMQLIGNYFEESRLLNVAHQYQQNRALMARLASSTTAQAGLRPSCKPWIPRAAAGKPSISSTSTAASTTRRRRSFRVWSCPIVR
jgi:hypothetical protein